MADGTQIGPVNVKGKVYNRSKEWLWVLFDKGGVVTAKYLAPGYKSPKDIDADALKAWKAGLTIDGHSQWWKLPSLITATVGDNFWGPGLRVSGSIPFVMSKTKESDWGDIQYDEYDENWGTKISPFDFG